MMPETEANAVSKGVRSHLNTLIGTPMIGMTHDIAGRFRDRQLKLTHAPLIEQAYRQLLTERLHEGPQPRQFRGGTGDFTLRLHQRAGARRFL